MGPANTSVFFVIPFLLGHMLEAHREGYRTIVIVDGLFERCPAVWHKEIMYVIENGGVVVGCSSMGGGAGTGGGPSG